MTKILDARKLEDKLAALGEGLFGRALRLRVAYWVMSREDPSFFQTEAVTGVGYAASGVVQELNRLVRLGMITRHEKTPGDRRLYYTRSESPLWKIVHAAAAAVGNE
ncbi:MAG: hypothetical protein ABI783_02190 [Actinomycetota bacterium]